MHIHAHFAPVHTFLPFRKGVVCVAMGGYIISPSPIVHSGCFKGCEIKSPAFFLAARYNLAQTVLRFVIVYSFLPIQN